MSRRPADGGPQDEPGGSSREPRDYRRIIDLVGGVLVSLVALLVAGAALVVALFSHSVVQTACAAASGPAACNGPLLTGGYVLTVAGIAVAVITVFLLQRRAYQRDQGLWAWPVLGMGLVLAFLLLGVLLMRTAHPAGV